MKQLTLKGIVFTALMSAILVIFGHLSISVGPVPITLQTLAVMLAGGLLGPRYGFLSMTLVIVLAAIGFPLLQGGTGGISYMLGTTGGYIVMWPFAAFLIGLCLSRIQLKGWLSYVAAFVIIELFGSLLLYVTGVPWLAHVLGVSFNKALSLGMYPFLVGDLIKAAAAAIIIASVRQVFPPARLTGSGGRTVLSDNKQQRSA